MFLGLLNLFYYFFLVHGKLSKGKRILGNEVMRIKLRLIRIEKVIIHT